MHRTELITELARLVDFANTIIIRTQKTELCKNWMADSKVALDIVKEIEAQEDAPIEDQIPEEVINCSNCKHFSIGKGIGYKGTICATCNPIHKNWEPREAEKEKIPVPTLEEHHRQIHILEKELEEIKELHQCDINKIGEAIKHWVTKQGTINSRLDNLEKLIIK